MDDYISRNSAIDMASQIFRESETLRGIPGALPLLAYAICAIPAADVVPTEEYATVVEQMNILAGKLIKIREIAGCRNE